MKLLFTLDQHNYSNDLPILERFAVRAIICRDNRYIMQQSLVGDYKIPGGGMEKGETPFAALLREVKEEVGLFVIPESIRPIGEILEKRLDIFDPNQIFIAHSYFYLCDVGEKTIAPQMTESEIRLGYQPSWATLDEIIQMNEGFQEENWQKRDLLFLKWFKESYKLTEPAVVC